MKLLAIKTWWKKLILSPKEFKILIAFSLIFFAIQLTWILLNSSPMSWDESGHFILSYEYSNILRELKVSEILTHSNYYPPLLYLLFGGLFVIFNSYSVIILQSVLVVLSSLNIILVYAYTHKLFRNHKLALIAATIFGLVPIVWRMSHSLLFESPLLLMVLIILLSADKIKRIRQGILVGLLVGVSLLIKWYSPVYFCLAFSGLILGKNWRHILSILISALAVAGPWYIINFQQIRNYLSSTVRPGAAEPTEAVSLANWVYYLSDALNNNAILLPLTALFLLSCFYIFRSKIVSIKYVLLQIVVIYVIFSLVPNKDARYIFPAIPFICICIAWLLVKVYRTRKSILAALFSFYLLINTSYAFDFPIKISNLNLVTSKYTLTIQNSVVFDLLNLSNERVWISPKYSNSDWSHNKIISDIKFNANKRDPLVLVTNEINRLNANNLTVSKIQNNPGDGVLFIDLGTLRENAFSRGVSIQEELKTVDFIIQSEEDYSIETYRYRDLYYELKEELIMHIKNNTKVNEYLLPDGRVTSLYEIN